MVDDAITPFRVGQEPGNHLFKTPGLCGWFDLCSLAKKVTLGGGGQGDIVKHQTVGQIIIAGNRKYVAAGFVLIGLHPRPKVFRVAGIIV